MKKITAERDDVAFYVKVSVIINVNPETEKKARKIVCSRSLAVLEAAEEKKPIDAPDCPTREVEENIKFAREKGISSVPAIIFPDGSVNEGFLDAARLISRIEEARKRSVATSPRQ
jgi:thiol:disulfide interchange protein DsbC